MLFSCLARSVSLGNGIELICCLSCTCMSALPQLPHSNLVKVTLCAGKGLDDRGSFSYYMFGLELHLSSERTFRDRTSAGNVYGMLS